jgi:hypothetical protein
MGYEILASFFAFILLPITVGCFIAFWKMTNHARAELEDSFRALADRRGREYVEAEGEWPNRTSASVAWTNEGVRFRLDSVGKEGGARTRLVAWPNAKLLGALIVTAADGAGRFERAFSVVARPRGFDERILDERAKKTMLAFRQGDDVRLAYRRGRLVLTWPGREMNEARIDEAERLVTDLVRSVEAAFHGARAA